MKNKFLLFITLIFSICTLSACADGGATTTIAIEKPNTPKTYTVLEAGGTYDSTSEFEHKVEFNLTAENIKDEVKTDSSEEITVGNVTVGGKYKNTVRNIYYNRSYDIYMSSASGYVYINAETGELIGYRFPASSYQKTEDRKTLSKEECVDIAWDYFKQNVSDYEDYRLREVQNVGDYVVDGVTQPPSYYNITYSRYINEICAMDSMEIRVNRYGDIIGIFKGNLGDMKGVNPLSGHNMTAIEQAVQEKLDKIYVQGVDKNDYEVKFATPTNRIVRYSDGRYALEYSVYTTITYKASEQKVNETVKLVVFLD